MFEGLRIKHKMMKERATTKRALKYDLMKAKTETLKAQNKIEANYQKQRNEHSKVKREIRERKLAPIRKVASGIRAGLKDKNVKGAGKRSRSMFQSSGKSKSILD